MDLISIHKCIKETDETYISVHEFNTIAEWNNYEDRIENDIEDIEIIDSIENDTSECIIL